MRNLIGDDWLNKIDRNDMMMFNVALDVSLHQDISKLWPNRDIVSELKGYNVATLKQNDPTVDWPEMGSPALYYSLLKQNPKGMGDGESQVLDDHDALLESWRNMSEAEKEEVRKQIRKIKEQGKIMRQRNPGVVDLGDEMYADSVELPAQMKKALDKILVKYARLTASSSDYRYSYDVYNRIREDAPGKRKENFPEKKVVLVLDTSGSMHDDLPKLASAVNYFVKKGKLGKVYCCDTELYLMPTPENAIKGMKMKGGGGTVFGSVEIDVILKDVKSKKVDVVYVTDGFVDLQEAEADDRIKLHTIVV
jgi:predicted metal-dependent peptidase